jgi:hypothetical protein
LCGKGNLDLEAIVTVIVDLKEKEHINENIGDLALFLSGGKKGLQILQRYWDIEERYLYV